MWKCRWPGPSEILIPALLNQGWLALRCSSIVLWIFFLSLSALLISQGCSGTCLYFQVLFAVKSFSLLDTNTMPGQRRLSSDLNKHTRKTVWLRVCACACGHLLNARTAASATITSFFALFIGSCLFSSSVVCPGFISHCSADVWVIHICVGLLVRMNKSWKYYSLIRLTWWNCWSL